MLIQELLESLQDLSDKFLNTFLKTTAKSYASLLR